LLVRAGAILPLGPPVQHTGERPLDELILQIYPLGASRLELYEDDGHSNAYRRGICGLTTIVCATEPGRISVRVEPPRGDRSVVPSGRRPSAAAAHRAAGRRRRRGRRPDPAHQRRHGSAGLVDRRRGLPVHPSAGGRSARRGGDARNPAIVTGRLSLRETCSS